MCYSHMVSIKDYTQIPSCGKPSCVDNFITNFHRDWSSSYIGDIQLSDHTTQEFAFSVDLNPRTSTVKFQVLRNKNVTQLKDYLRKIVWTSVYEIKEVDLATSQFVNILTTALDTHCP
uniref:Uncharacterized protein n=1 Tax=Homalodisca liturata TaxID=320908 RepID=A0A1B6J8G0_9HEMI